jgi:membrane protease YdiL (CAAX protease family)
LKPFLDLANTGKPGFLRYLLGIVLVLLIWIALGALVIILHIVWAENDNSIRTFYNSNFGGVVGFSNFTNYMILNITFWPLILGIYFVINKIHKRSLKTLVTPREKIRYGRIIKAFITFFLLLGLAHFVDYLLWPEHFRFRFNEKVFIPFLIVVPIMTSIQVLSEELLLRGYLLQATSKIWRNSLFLILINSSLFVLLHIGNPEVTRDSAGAIIYYFIFGAAATYLTLRDNSIELALAMHAAVNIFLSLVVSAPGGILETEPPIRMVGHFAVGAGLIGFIACLIIFRLIFIRKENRD